MSNFELERVTLAVVQVEAMVRFYEQVFQVSLKRIQAYGTTLYEGTAHGVPMRLCPNDVAGVRAERSRHQFEVSVEDLEELVARVRAAGGMVQNEAAYEGRRAAAVVDPDRNTWVFLERR